MKSAFPYVHRALPDWLVPVTTKVFDKMENDGSGHDFLHAVRVMELAADIAKELERGEDLAATAGLLHDYDRKEERQTGRLHYGPEAIADLRREFGPLIVPVKGEGFFDMVLEAISLHEEYGDEAGIPLDAQILQDADRIEALGAVGIARAFMFGGAHGLPMIEKQQAAVAAGFDPAARPQGSVHRHFYEKLLLLADGMHTEPGKRMAMERHRFVVMFIKEFESELKLAPIIKDTRRMPSGI